MFRTSNNWDAASFSVLGGVLFRWGNGKEEVRGVVGVTLRDFEVGNRGKAESWEIDRSGNGEDGGIGIGEVALRDGIW